MPIFVTLWRIAPGQLKEATRQGSKTLAAPPKGVKVLATYFTFGRSDAIWIYEAPNEEAAFKLVAGITAAKSETMLAIPREKGLSLIE